MGSACHGVPGGVGLRFQVLQRVDFVGGIDAVGSVTGRVKEVSGFGRAIGSFIFFFSLSSGACVRQINGGGEGVSCHVCVSCGTYIPVPASEV